MTSYVNQNLEAKVNWAYKMQSEDITNQFSYTCHICLSYNQLSVHALLTVIYQGTPNRCICSPWYLMHWLYFQIHFIYSQKKSHN